MTGNRPTGPAEPGGSEGGERQVADELARFAAVLAAVGAAAPEVEPGADLRRRLVRAAAT